MKRRIRLTPVGHYFLGGERGFGFDSELKRQMSDSYFISSLKIPSQTTLFGALRYIIGVKDEQLRENSCQLIGKNSYRINDTKFSYGIIESISPVYLYKEHDSEAGEYYIRTPFDHKMSEYKYTPLELLEKEIKVINYPSKERNKTYPKNYVAKDGISHSYMSLTTKAIEKENDIFTPSVEVVSKKDKGNNAGKDCFAKKEYMRLKDGWSFVFFADLSGDKDLEFNKSVILGKDSSVFTVKIDETEEPDVISVFQDRPANFHYCQSPIYITSDVSNIVEESKFSIIENESQRIFMTENQRLRPAYDSPLLQLISPGSIFYTDTDSDNLKKQIESNGQAVNAGFNRIIKGGSKK